MADDLLSKITDPLGLWDRLEAKPLYQSAAPEVQARIRAKYYGKVISKHPAMQEALSSPEGRLQLQAKFFPEQLAEPQGFDEAHPVLAKLGDLAEYANYPLSKLLTLGKPAAELWKAMPRPRKPPSALELATSP